MRLHKIILLLGILGAIVLQMQTGIASGSISVEDADAVRNFTLNTAPSDALNSTDASQQETFIDVYVNDADVARDFNLIGASEDALDSTDASQQETFIDVYVNDADVARDFNLIGASEDALDSTDASQQETFIDVYVCDADATLNFTLSTPLHIIPKLNVNVLLPPEGFSTLAGSELIVNAKVFDGEDPLKNAEVDGKLSSISFSLYDDGKSSHGDDVEDDGIYSAKITVPKSHNAVFEINARYEDKFGSASRNINIDTSPEQPLKVEAEIIDDNPPMFTGDTVTVKAVVSLNGSIVNNSEVKSTITYPNSYQKNITLQNKGDYYEADFDWLFQGGEYTFDVIAYPQENAIQGYDTKKLKVYHGSLSITQEGTGTTFKIGEPVEFKVEVTCSGLTCPDKVNNAEVRMKILPDGEEIALIGYGDGKYKTNYIFTNPGIRDISFSASAPFCIQAELNGDSIEIEEEDCELKSAVEQFADDNIATLEATKLDAEKLANAGDYFFDKIDEDTAGWIASIIAKPLAYLTVDPFFPSKDYAKWYEELLEPFVEVTVGKVEEAGLKKFIIYCLDGTVSESFFGSDSHTYQMCMDKFNNDINTEKEDTLSNFPIIPDEQRDLYLDDLNERNKANNQIKNLISKEVEFPCECYEARLAEENKWNFLKAYLMELGVDGIVTISSRSNLITFMGSAFWDTRDTVKHLNEDGRLVTITSQTFSDMYVKSKKIKGNTVSGISQFKDANPPEMPKVEVMSIIDVSEGYSSISWLGKITWVEKECYTIIVVKNNGTYPVNVWTVAPFSNVIDVGGKSLDPGKTETIRIDYSKYKPKGGDFITLLVFSETEDRIYIVKDGWRIFSPIYVSTLTPLTKSCLTTERSQKQSENLTVIANPIESTLARVNMTTYEVTITARNPFPYPINAEITQNTSSWNVSIPPRETNTLNYIIQPELGIETTIPPAYMEYFDFQYNATLIFATDAINFTAIGIEISGDLPYEISDYMEVNLSITNLLNITNVTFDLELISNETFEYNVTANIENVSLVTVEFGPADVPEGEYIGILSFDRGDEKLIIDSRNMRKTENEPPIANFTCTPLNPTVNQAITFDATTSYDPDGNITSYDWNFGDGNTTNTTEKTIAHSYASAGDYNVILTVTDDDGAMNSTSKTITINPLRGDLNSDGILTPADAAIALRMAVRGEYADAADVSGDGKVTSLDALMIMQVAAGVITL